MAFSSDVPKGKRRNKNRSIAARGLLYVELGYVNSLTPKTAATVGEVCLKDRIQLEEIMMGHYRCGRVSRNQAATACGVLPLTRPRRLRGNRRRDDEERLWKQSLY
ncbi:Hypp5375 [Branchiostoma lanceolatum]|uniref:Hypp5375 protein n=1 Tax=Branchiostoma lanceolatum TaxID=7740 RepID=A0A8K0F1H5_BRALA|nr:Hypp5375 [Branchiostoma lanceolatum]